MTNSPSDFINDHRTSFEKGYVQVYTGDGKGKTTAAIGLAIRAAGAGFRVFIAQFIKSGQYSEIKMLDQLKEWITCRQYGRGCWIRGKPSPEDAAAAHEGLVDVRNVIASGTYQIVILDEINVATWFNILTIDDVLGLIDIKPERMELVFTGRKADPKLLERADLVTEMREIKHYYQQGVIARTGIES
ncbi:cob(I)yrinic acid a,c-diamide adenosyltransferase [bacterium]|nr:cob(I)yrinic acid a,c-diamide adenosyltransferase [candidate division CSSED10-310 bacterium]